MDLVWSPALKAAGAKLCTKATEAEPRTKDISEADKPRCNLAQSPLIITNKLPDSQLGKDAHSSRHTIAPQPITSRQPSSRNFLCLEAIKAGY